MNPEQSVSNLADLPAVTIVIEWENAIDVHDKWTQKALAALQKELESAAGRMPSSPTIFFLYDRTAVDLTAIEQAIASSAPKLRDLASVDFIPTDGLSYYKLKNFGIARSNTDLTIMLDSDAAPQPGWLANLLEPFADPSIMVVGGFTVLAYDDLLSKTMALSWIFNLADEQEKTVKRQKIHANNCAVRTDFFRKNPFPDLPVFKKQCGFWLRDLSARGYRYVRTEKAMTVHAPHPGYRFLVWRAWTTGTDRDFQGFHTVTQSRVGRIAFAFRFFGTKLARSWSRIIRRGAAVELPIWQRPPAMAISLSFFLIAFAGQLTSAVTRSFGPLPKSRALVRRSSKPSVEGSPARLAHAPDDQLA